jgi:thiol-disulfide isomerase/thioredoxin
MSLASRSQTNQTMKKTLTVLTILFCQLAPNELIQKRDLEIKLTLRPTYERHDYFSPVPIAIVTNEYTLMNRRGEFEVRKLIIPKNELKSENGVIEIFFTGGPKDSKTLALVSDFKSKNPRFYIDHNQNGNFEDDGPFQQLSHENKIDITLRNSIHPKGQYLVGLEKMVIPDQKVRERWKSNIKRGPRYSKLTLAEPDYWFRDFRFNILSANVEVNGLKFQIGLFDSNINGLYNDEEDRLLIGEYGNGRMLTDLNENNYIIGDNTPFAIGNKGFEIISIDPTGTNIKIKPLEFGNVKSKLKVGDSFPEFTVNSIEGSNENITNLIEKGKYNYIEFWGTWCKGCVTELPTIKAISDRYPDELNIISLHYGKITTVKLQKFIKSHDMSWVQKIATEEAVKAMKVSGYPYGILVNPEGEVEAFNIRIEEVEERINGKH